MQRKINMLLLLFSLIGATIGFAISEVVMLTLPEAWPSYVAVGLYFGILALCIGLSCLIAEMISPKLNGHSWRQRYMDLSWKLLLPATLVSLFVIGGALQFVFGLDFGGTKKVRDIVLVIDNSGSMTETDPNNDRYKAAKGLIAEMNKEKRVAIVTFADASELYMPFVSAGTVEEKNKIYEVMDSITATEGGTNYSAALQTALDVIKEKQFAERGTMAILLSDGFSESDITAQINEFQNQNIALHTIGLKIGNDQGVALLQDIADSTGGRYYDVSKSDGLAAAFSDIYMTIDNRMLHSINANAPEEHSIYKMLRVLSFVVIGLAIGLSLGLMFDNRFLALSFGTGGIVGGLIAGFIMNAGLSGHSFTDGLIRLLAALVLALVISLFTLVVPVGERKNTGRGRSGSLESPVVSSRNGRNREGRSHGF
ncbi:VWA domain-containing protein [Paenibacillus sp. GSMTC-2017]|uniref:vWA domain-containing protein n=1 Tax=Paenibacillus sp. GSMTC-2017 TaxID=2794350 RepID=UPI0018D843D0|nr:vWA domain-containing protein [Paenibacillus sp. GSMTC-2017]MBH5318392.1 VWA domain-containing protein [Paenibacillus sp. GSMTC-2017]